MNEDPAAEGAAHLLCLTTGLPAPVAKPAIATLSQFLGAIFSEQIAKSRAKAQPIEDETFARSLMARTAAVRAAEVLGRDEAFAERAALAHVSEVMRKQANKEAVAGAAMEELRRALPSPEEPLHVKEPEEDWLNVFATYAERASSERMRLLWGKVLAGELRKDGAFSLRTLRFLSELDADTAKLFEQYAPKAVGGLIYQNSEARRGNLADLVRLEEAGLVTGAGGTLSMTVTIPTHGSALWGGRALALRFVGVVGTEVNLDGVILTKIAEEILPILGKLDEEPVLRRISEDVPKANLSSIWLTKREGSRWRDERQLWKKPEP